MPKSLPRLFLFAAILWPAGHAQACLNDRDVAVAEHEFRSAYLKQPSPSPAAAGYDVGNAMLIAGGVLVVLSALVLSRTPR